MKRIYLATPYSWKTPKGIPRNLSFLARIIQWWRYKKVTKAAALLMIIEKVNIFSPITHSHPIAPHIPHFLDTHTTWLDLDFNWIDICDELWVYCQKGWDKSFGVKQEILYASKHHKKIRYIKEGQLKLYQQQLAK